MKVLVAVKRPYTEFCWAEPGELLWENPAVCCSSVSCGCNRALSGVDSLRSTTTAEVVEREDLSRDDVFDLAAKIGRASGFGGEIVLPCLQGAIEAAEGFEVGDIVETRFEMVDNTNGRWVYARVDEEKAKGDTDGGSEPGAGATGPS